MKSSEILIYEEGNDYYSELDRSNRCRVILRSKSGISDCIIVQEEIHKNSWMDIERKSEKEREVLDDCIYFAISPYFKYSIKDIPIVRGYSVGP